MSAFIIYMVFSLMHSLILFFFFFFLNDPAPPEIYTLPLHDAFPILSRVGRFCRGPNPCTPRRKNPAAASPPRQCSTGTTRKGLANRATSSRRPFDRPGQRPQSGTR